MALLLKFGLMVYKSGNTWTVASIKRDVRTSDLLHQLQARNDISLAVQLTAFLSEQKLKGRLRVIPTAEQYLMQAAVEPF